ncbi:MAG TPA: acyl-CoA dehydrogenase family protein [Baekduia sp.]
MDLALSPDERAIQEAFAALFEKESTPERVRAAAGAGFDPALWSLLAELGAVGIGVPEHLGGAGAGLVELVLIAEEWGARAACVPLVEAATAARVLSAWAAAPGVASLLERVVAGDAVAAFAPRPPVDGVARALPGGAVADVIVALDGDDLVAVEDAPPGGRDDLGHLAVADRPLAGPGVRRTVLAHGSDAHRAMAQARAEWRVATAGALAGLAREALDIGVRYARDRRQFGTAIGAFQALQQPFADAVTATDGAQLLAREAAWRMDRGLDGGDFLADVAYAHAARTAVDAAQLSLHVHGGYGYALEYDIHLYLLRATGLSLAAGDPDELWEEIGAASAMRAVA